MLNTIQQVLKWEKYLLWGWVINDDTDQFFYRRLNWKIEKNWRVKKN